MYSAPSGMLWLQFPCTTFHSRAFWTCVNSSFAKRATRTGLVSADPCSSCISLPAREIADPSYVLEKIVLYARGVNADVDHLLKVAYGIQVCLSSLLALSSVSNVEFPMAQGFSTQVLNKHLMKAEAFVRNRGRPCRSRSSSTIGLVDTKNLPSMGFLQGPKQVRSYG